MNVDVLLSGFEPFAGADMNESWEAARRATTALQDQGIATADLRLPVEFGAGAEALLAATRVLRPRIVIATGLAAGREAITPERVAVYVQDARIPDNAGASPVDEPSVPGGPVGYFSTLPIKALVDVARTGAGVPAAVSQSAGTYVCNDVFYRLMHALATEDALGGVRGGFVHVPARGMIDADAAGRALEHMVIRSLSPEPDLAMSGGAES